MTSVHSPFDYSSETLAGLPRHSVSVAGIVIDTRGRVLAIRRRDNGHWQPPGGVLETHEAFDDGVRREVLEETGVYVEVERLSGVYKNVKAGIVTVAFRCRPLNEPMTATDEAAGIAWLDPADARRLMTSVFATRIVDAFEPVPQIRTHDGTNLLS